MLMIVGITRGEYLEYLQNGSICIKDYPVSFPSRWQTGYRMINFEEVLEAYRIETELSPSASYGTSKRMIAAVEFGLIRVEDFGENYILEAREREYNKAIVERLRTHGYEAEEVGCFRLIDVKKKPR